MVAEDLDNYIAEIARVMKLGGVCSATFLTLWKSCLICRLNVPEA